MNKNLQTKTFKDSVSLGVRDCNKKVNRTTNEVATALINRKERYGEKINNSIKQTQLSCPLPNSKDVRPPLIKEEINQLAKAWCELLLGQIQEVRNQPVPLKLKPLRI